MTANSNCLPSLARATRSLSLVLATAFAVGCKADSVVNANEPSQLSIDADVRAGVQLRVSGALALERSLMPGYISSVGILGRESFNYTGTEARNTTEYLRNTALTNSSFLAGGQWDARYRDIRNLADIVALADRAEGNTLTPAERSAVKGLANTLWAIDMYYVIATRDSLGAPTELVVARDSAPPFVRRDSVYKFVLGKLNEGRTQLAAGGASFPVALHSGYAPFNTPATFTRFNRAFAARVLVAKGTLPGGGGADFTAALAALNESFLDRNAPLTLGAYHVFSTASGDALNLISPVNAPDQLAHPSIEADAAAETGPGGAPDRRFSAKVNKLAIARAAPQSAGIPTQLQYKIYPVSTSPVPIIRNEELILLRAEANLGLGNLTAALADIDFIRVNSGGLAPTALTAASGNNAILTELLRQKRFSLLFEGHRWVDVRRYGRLGTLPLDLPSHVRVQAFPIPTSECDARTNIIRKLGAAANAPYTGLAAPSCPVVTI